MLLEVDEDELIERLHQRAVEEDRADDNIDTIRKRMQVYKSDTQPLIDYFDERAKLRRIDGMGTVEEVFARITEVLP